ncbi:MAG: YdcF family protein [Clostridia bacterium]|nr:YdcF family protein [Clostridia bacterium]
MKDKENNRRLSPRRIIGDILLFLSALLTADVIIVMMIRIGAVVRKEVYIKSFLIELAMLAVLIVFSLDVRFRIFTLVRSKAAAVAGRIMRICVICMTAVILFFCCRVMVGGMIDTSARADHAIVLGIALENGKPTDDLLSRISTAEDYLKENSGAVLILTGGNPDGSGKTEAAVMGELLKKDGVSDDKFILEDKAESTAENFENTVKIIGPDAPVVLITSDYHMERAVGTAKRAGFKSILRLPAPSDFWTYGADMMWEVVHEINELLG